MSTWFPGATGANVPLERAAYDAYDAMRREMDRLDQIGNRYLYGTSPDSARAVIIAARHLTSPRHAITGTLDIIRLDDPTYQPRRAA